MKVGSIGAVDGANSKFDSFLLQEMNAHLLDLYHVWPNCKMTQVWYSKQIWSQNYRIKVIFDKLWVNENDTFFHQLRQNMTTWLLDHIKKNVLISKKEAIHTVTYEMINSFIYCTELISISFKITQNEQKIVSVWVAEKFWLQKVVES